MRKQEAGGDNSATRAPSAHKITLGEHTGTHVDVFNHFSAEHRERGIDTMPLGMFITSAYTHYENLINWHQLVGLGRFQFIGLPLKIRGGTGSPVRAVAVIE